VRPGDVVWNPLTGEKAMLVEGPEETSGERIVADFAVEEGGFVPGGEHVHDICTEHFEVQAGQITFLVDGRQRTAGPGDQLTVQPGSWHRWWNAGEGEVRIRTRVEPALRFAEAILVFWGLCADGHTNAEGTPSPLYGALLAKRYRDEIRFRKPPQLVQRVLVPALAAVAAARSRARDRALPRPRHAPFCAGRLRAAARSGHAGEALARVVPQH
jgi:mannose-6-phosphate isomerase-like protein (cupin superfamily)